MKTIYFSDQVVLSLPPALSDPAASDNRWGHLSRGQLWLAKLVLCLMSCLLTGQLIAEVAGVLDATYVPDVRNRASTPNIRALAIQPDGKMLIGGDIESVDGTAHFDIARLLPSGAVDNTFNATINGQVKAIAVQADGKIVVGGIFTAVNSQARANIARLNADGSLDTTFETTGVRAEVNPQVNAIVILPSGQMLIGGNFSSVEGTVSGGYSAVARLLANGRLDTAFVNSLSVSNTVMSLAVQPDGKIVAGGVLTNNITRLNDDGTVDDRFRCVADAAVHCVAVQQDGTIVIGGAFTSLNGETSFRIGRLLARGDVDPGFAQNDRKVFNLPVHSLGLQARGKIIVGGAFTNVLGVRSNAITRLNGDGTLDTTFGVDGSGVALGGATNASEVFGVAQQADGKILIGGVFTRVNGVSRPLVARLSNEPVTPEIYIGSPTSGGWDIGNAGPEFTSVHFEMSVNGGSTWTPIGAGAKAAEGKPQWRFAVGTPLAFPVSIRATGRTASGNGNGSGGLITQTQAFALPAVTLGTSAQGSTSVNIQVNVVDEGSPKYSFIGMAWNTTSFATTTPPGTGNNRIAIANSSGGAGTGGATSTVAGGFPAGTQICARAFAETSLPPGYVYGPEVKLTTDAALPTVTTTVATNIATSSANLGGNVTFTGGQAISISNRGVVWSITPNSTTANNPSLTGTTPLAFSGTVGGMPSGTVIYYRAFATNSAGTAYGTEMSFTTAAPVPPTLDNPLPRAITRTSAELGFWISAYGTPRHSENGVVWSPSTIPTSAVPGAGNTKTPGTLFNNLGGFHLPVTGLQPNKLYYTRPYTLQPTNPVIHTYGPEATFTTLPQVTTTAQTGVGPTSATLNGSVAVDGGANITGKGIVWSTATILDTVAPASQTSPATMVPNGTGTGAINVSVTTLPSATTIYYRAYAINAGGFCYGAEMSFATPAAVAPVLTTPGPRSFTRTSAELGIWVVSPGTPNMSELGAVYSITTIPTTQVPGTGNTKIATNGTVSGGGFGFHTNATGLQPNRLYYTRPYALQPTNPVSHHYGPEATFTTLPQVTTTAQTGVGPTSATLNGNVTVDGGANITGKGIVWSTATILDTVAPASQTSPATMVPNGTGTGAITVPVTTLPPATTIYYRAYAINAGGFCYGTEMSFATPAVVGPLLDVNPGPRAITRTSAQLGFWISAFGAPMHNEDGIVWSTATIPAASAPGSGNTKVSNGLFGNLGGYHVTVSGLQPNKLYYTRPYALQPIPAPNHTYGPEATFTTLPQVTTTAQTGVGPTSATLNGSVAVDGGATITGKGIVWSTATILDTVAPASQTSPATMVPNGTGTGAITVPVTTLPPATTIHYRAYAINAGGFCYGAEMSFATPAAVPPTLDINPGPRAITRTSAELGFWISAYGNPRHSENGIVWSASTIPVASAPGTGNTKVPGTLFNTLGGFHLPVTGLQPNKVYYTRPYALQPTTPVIHTYGPEATFTTLPQVTTTAQTPVSPTSSNMGGTIAIDGGATITGRGVVWSTATMLDTVAPNVQPNQQTMGIGTGNFTGLVSTLPPGTTIYYRAYGINAGGFCYGAEMSFTTAPALPTVTTTAQTNVTSTSATLGGNVTSSGGANVTVRGIVWSSTGSVSTTIAPGSQTNNVPMGSGTGAFSNTVNNLPPNTQICYRAYAINSVGYVYGPEICFTTAQTPLAVNTLAASPVTSLAANLLGVVVTGANITERGFVYSTTVLAIANNVAPGAQASTTKQTAPLGLGLGAFSFNLTPLTAGTTIRYRAYALSGAAYAYGAEFTIAPQQENNLDAAMSACDVRVTCFSGGSPNGDSAGQINTAPSSLSNTGKLNNTPPMFHHPDWVRSRMGEVFGICLDDQPRPNSFATATSIYNTSFWPYFNQWPSNGAAGDTFGSWGKTGGVYIMDGITGNVTNYAEVPNAGSPAKASTPGSLGNICFDAQRRRLFITNLDDGWIYTVPWQTGTVGLPLTATRFFDHGTQGRINRAGLSSLPDVGTSGVTRAGRRVWAVQIFSGRLYYSVWNGTGIEAGSNGANSEVWSVAFTTAGAADALSARLEFDTGRTMPIADIAINDSGTMMTAERGCRVSTTNETGGIIPGMIDTHDPHNAQIHQYTRNVGLQWVPTGNNFNVGYYLTNNNSSGGIDLDCDDSVYAPGNALAYQYHTGYAWYGLQVIPNRTNPTGNSDDIIGRSHIIDYDNQSSTMMKSTIGDVALKRHPCECFLITSQEMDCQGNILKWKATMTNTGAFDIRYLEIANLSGGVTSSLNGQPITYIPEILIGETRVIEFQFTLPTNVPEEFCFDILSKNRLQNLCCPMNICLRPECCMRIADEKFTPTTLGRWNYCFKVTNFSGATATRVILASNPMGSACPQFINPIFPLIPPLANGETREVCTTIFVPTNCNRLNFVISLHDANYRQCCSQPRTHAWCGSGQVTGVYDAVARRLPALADLSCLRYYDGANIIRVDYLVDGVVVGSAPVGQPYIISGLSGAHQVSYVVASYYGAVIEGSARSVNFGNGGLSADSGSSEGSGLRFSTTSEGLVLRWDDSAAVLETSTSLSGDWHPVENASSPFLPPTDAQRRFYRVVRPN